VTGESNSARLKLDDINCVEIGNPAVMNKHPLVSVHMITFNHEPYIARAIEGVLMQETDFPIELVIGEDCSTDRTREIVLEYQRKHPDVIRVVLWDKNVGIRRNSQRLDGLLRGKYVAFNEGDDYWTHPKKLQKQVDVLESKPEMGLVSSGFDRYTVETGKLIRWRPRRYRPSRYTDKFTMMLTGAYPYPRICTVCMRRDLLVSVRRDNPDTFSDEFPMADTQTWLEASRVADMEAINESLAVHNILRESACHSRDAERIREFLRLGNRLLLKFVRKYNCPREVEGAVLRIILGIAFEYRDSESAQDASRRLKEIHGSLTVGEKLLLYGTVNTAVRPFAIAVKKAKSLLAEALPSGVVEVLRRWWGDH
jgi:glycosyltransferase involved in cell wall biosynthesis